MNNDKTIMSVENVIQDSMMEYAAYVLLHRAIPKLEDGLKPVYRRMLYTMHKLNVTRFTKSANVIGRVMEIHAHGSSYSSAVGMAQKDRHAIPFITGKGNWGQYTSSELMYAADRYTEMKLSPISMEMLKNLNKEVTPMVPNYDGTQMEPEILPVRFPTILSFAQSGIGVGFSSSLPSFNLGEICDEVINFVKTNEHNVLIPDFATGGNIINNKNIFEQINREGKGTISIRGKAEIEGNTIYVTEVPYGVTRETIINKIINLAKTNKLKEISDVIDLTGLKGMKFAIEAKKKTDMELLLEKLYRYTALESTYSCNMNILVNGLPKVMGVHEIIERWIEWRIGIIKIELNKDIKSMKKQLHIMEALKKVLLDVDKTIDIIRNTDGNEIEDELSNHFNIDYTQAKEVADMRLRNINEKYINKQLEKVEKLKSELAKAEDTLTSDKKIKKIIIKDLEEIKKNFAIERRSILIEKPNETKNVIEKEIIEEYDCFVYLTKDGYVYKYKNEENPTLKPNDVIVKTFRTKNTGILGIVDENRVMHKIKISDLKINKKDELGTYLKNIKKELNNILTYVVIDDTIKEMLTIYKEGKVNITHIDDYTKGVNILKNVFNEKFTLCDMIPLKGSAQISLIIDKKDYTIDTSLLKRAKLRFASGNYIKKGEVKSFNIIE